MPVSTETINRELFDVLRSRDYDPVSLDSKGDPTEDTENADVFRFSVSDAEEGTPVNAWATIDGNNLRLYINDKFVHNKEFEPLTKFLKRWSQRKLLGFDITNKDRLLGDMKKRTVMKKKEQVLEGYYPMGKKASYNDSIPAVKMIIQHTRQIEEGEQRFRNIAKIFVENINGERFLLPTIRPGLARVYARHIAEGGTPYDDKGKHITSLVEEYSKMAGFVRATRNGQFNESALRLVNEGITHYNNLRMTLQGMTSHRGYNKYFESYSPVLNEESDDNSNLNELFVQETLDPRIENVLPILNRLSKNINEMNEVKELGEWAESITEVEDETTKTLAEPAEDMLDEIGIGTLYQTKYEAHQRIKAFKAEIEKLKKLNNPEAQEKISKYEKAIKHYDSLIDKAKMHPEKMGMKLRAKALGDKMPAKLKKVAEAPGAETLAHNDKTEKSNLDAFDLDEVNLRYYYPAATKADIMKKIKKKFNRLEEGFTSSQEAAEQIMTSLIGQEKLSSDDVYAAIDEYQSMMDSPHKLDTDEVAQILYDRLNLTDSDLEEKIDFTKKIADHNKKKKETDEKVKQHQKDQKEKSVEEDLDANQKRVGQLGPTEKVGPKGAVGKLVGASESREFDDIKRLAGLK